MLETTAEYPAKCPRHPNQTRTTKLVLIIGATVGLAIPHGFAQQAPPALTGADMPLTLGQAKRGEIKDFEASNPGLGQAIAYQAPGWRNTLFVYDLKRKDLPEKADAALIAPQLQQAAGDILTLKKRGDYADVHEGLAFTVPTGANPRFHCKSYVLKSATPLGGVKSASSEFDSYLCVTTWRKKFVKARMTTERRASAPREAAEFIAALDQALKP